MGLLLILATLVALCLGIAGWLWLAGGALRGGWRGALGIAALQASGLCLIWGMVKGAPLVGLYTALFPPLALFDLARLSDLGAFLAPVLGVIWPWGLGALAAALLWRPLRPWAPGLGLAGLMLAGAALSEGVSVRLMCEAARTRGLSELRRVTVLESLSFAARGEARPVHGLAKGPDGAIWAWSYGSADWFPLPPEVNLTGAPQPFTCKA